MGGNFYLYPVLRNSLPQSLNILDHECCSDSAKNTRSSTTETESLKILTKINKLKNCHSSILFRKILENFICTRFISTINHGQTCWVCYTWQDPLASTVPIYCTFLLNTANKRSQLEIICPVSQRSLFFSIFFFFLQTIHLCNDVFCNFA